MEISDHYRTLSIASLGPATLPKPAPSRYVVKAINEIGDIDGARTVSRYSKYYDKPKFDQSNIPGSTSKILSRSRNVRDNTLYIDDIEGTRYAIRDRMMRTNRHINPMVPEYQLPSCKISEPEVPKFIKDPLQVRDIEGTAPKEKKIFATRNIMSIDDIVGAQAGWKPTHKKVRKENEPHDILDVSDISARNHRYIDKTKRVSDVLNPKYHINGMDYYDEYYTRPKPLKKFIPDTFFLQTKDINNASVEQQYSFQRREFRNTNYLGDIKGAQADSIKHSIQTNRQTNPLNPIYQALDPGDLLLPVITPLIPSSTIKFPTVRTNVKSVKDPATHNNVSHSTGLFDTMNTTAPFDNTTSSQFDATNSLKLDFEPINSKPSTINFGSGKFPPMSGTASGGGTSRRTPPTSSMMIAHKKAEQERINEINLVKELNEHLRS